MTELSVSCVMPTADRGSLALRAIRCFREQDYSARELVVLDDGERPIGDCIPDDPRIRYIRLDRKTTLGAKRNLLCREAAGDVVVHWDDDDWMATWRLTYQVGALVESGADVCGLDRLYFHEPVTGRAWQYVYPARARFWVAGATLCYRKAFWRAHPFPSVDVGEDTRFVWSGDARRMIALADSSFYVATIHAGNTSRKRTDDPRYRPVPEERIRAMMEQDFDEQMACFGAAPRDREAAP